jgi:hypothetical protein
MPGIVPTGAGMFSPHFLQQIVKSHCRVGGRLNTSASIGKQKAKLQPGCLLVGCGGERQEVSKFNNGNGLERYVLIYRPRSGSIKSKVIGPLCEFRLPPTFASLPVCCLPPC